jgi:uncharacterized protein YfaT (DUF1175 family)
MRRREALALLPIPVMAFGSASPTYSDAYSDGTPDFLRLRSRADQEAFRAWFVWLAEALAASQPEIPQEVEDCAGLLRFAYREALVVHDGAWAAALRLETPPPLPDVRQYHYPVPELNGALFRVRPGPFRASDLRTGAFRHFADAEHLMRYNTYRLDRRLEPARPADLLFYRQLVESMPFHSMICTGTGAVYHTGPLGGAPGEIRRVTVAELRAHPEPRWHPVPGNPNFLGVFRWTILREPS